MTQKLKIDVREILRTLSQASSYQQEGEFKKAIDLCDKLLAKYPVGHKAMRDVLYVKAINLDISGEATNALPIITELTTRFPMNPHYQKSLVIIVGNCHDRASSIHEQNPQSPILRNYYNLMREYHSAALWLTEAVAMLDIIEGNPLGAREKMRDLLELSPKDIDYLVASLRIAKALNDELWQASLRRQIAAVTSERPDLEELCNDSNFCDGVVAVGQN